MNIKTIFNVLFIGVAAFANLVSAQNKPKVQPRVAVSTGKEITILITAMPHSEKQKEITAKLQNTDFDVQENKRSQKIISVKNSSEVPIDLAIVIQENLDWRVNGELQGLREFIRKMPAGSRVMTAYLTIGGAIVTHELTADLKKAADSLRVRSGSSFPSMFSPYYGVQDVVKHFDAKSKTRRNIIVVSDGLDLSGGYYRASPYFSISLSDAIRDAQRSGIAVSTIYAPSEELKYYGRFAVNYGQASLIRLADETGGEAFISGLDFVNFFPYLEEFKHMNSRQWLITYRSSSTKKGFRQLEVKTDFDLHLHHPAGYEPGK